MWSWEAEKRLATGIKTGKVTTDATKYTVCGLQLGVEYVFVVRGALSPGMTGRASAVSPRFKTYSQYISRVFPIIAPPHEIKVPIMV